MKSMGLSLLLTPSNDRRRLGRHGSSSLMVDRLAGNALEEGASASSALAHIGHVRVLALLDALHFLLAEANLFAKVVGLFLGQ